ncbi:MAG: VWA domain-containing protein, partial [Planctomycetota bacterium]|nr:VWA domain-containing protein [Planctomycetota bacterium]
GAGLNATGLVCQSVDVGELERWLPEAHLLLTLDLAPADLPAEVLASFVHRGGVWLALGEKSMLPGWSGRSVMNGKDLGALLPLTPDHGDGPAKDVILLVDGSGSMQGDPWTQVQSATLTLLRNIPREVGFEVDLFTHDLLEAELRLAPVQEGEGEVEQRRTEASLRSFLEARVPGGKTNIMSSLKSLLERRGDRGACKLVLITDGWQNDGGSWDPAWLRAQMGGVGMELSIVATSENPNLADLGLLMDREHILLAEDLVGLAELLKEELMGDVIRRDPDMRVSGGEAGKGLAWGLEDRLLESSAPVASFVKTKPRPGAEVLLQADRAEPIFSVVTRGRGAVAQVTSLQGAEFLWDGFVGLRGLVSELAHWARAQQGGGPDIVALDGNFFLEGAGEGAELLAREGLSNDWTRVPLEMGLGGSGLDPRDWLRLNLEPFEGQDLESLELRLSVPGSVPEALVLPISAPDELLPGGHVWPRELPQAVPAGAPVGSGTHPSGPVALVLGLLAVVAGLGFRVLGGKGFAESADRN